VKSAVDVRRLRREIDRTLELAPDYSDALVGKGALLLDLPRLLGGDPAEGERLLRAALRVDPDYVDARLKLARALDARGAKAEAREEAVRAVAAAERDPDDREQLEEARELLTRLAR
jgi:tetratricopeptide (TPR) repeat protein